MNTLKNVNKKYSELAENALLKESKDKKFQKKFWWINGIFVAVFIIFAIVIIYNYPPCYLFVLFIALFFMWVYTVFFIGKRTKGNKPSEAEIEEKAKSMMKERIDFAGPKVIALRKEANELNDEHMGLLAAYMFKG